MKARAFLLGTGYAESSSYSQLILIHPKGFDSVQEAMIDIRHALIDMIKQEQEDDKRSAELIKKMRGDNKGDPYANAYLESVEGFLAQKPEDLVETVLHDIIHGDFQVHGEFWEFMSGRGWLVGNAWFMDYINKYPFIMVDRAPEAVAECEKWDEGYRLFEDVPKGIKLLRKKQ